MGCPRGVELSSMRGSCSPSCRGAGNAVKRACALSSVGVVATRRKTRLSPFESSTGEGHEIRKACVSLGERDESRR